ncbi:protein RICE SALT SENSITIVE 3-like isoform X2 [Prosopis cineraria]|uniref:protein RICE SALT SENSITIVE 3-like isoform X2 n=1 Tax=Prosopis cineraria TaxID=364024 RepID=UPI00240EFA35|nr:protein RICE SALT SENSITIVE 3-like isoform X2 [Prosopis cineraria]
MRPSEASVSTQIGLILSSGPYVLARICFSLRLRGGNGCKAVDDNGSLMLMWEDGFCRGRISDYLEDINNGEEDPVRKAFSKMSIQLYNYGEGLMGKVASDKCHKWVFKEASGSEPNVSNYWQSSFDALPPEWTDQFESGIQTIAVIQAGHGLLQLGSCKIIAEDLHFVLRMRHTFESLGYQSGFYLSHLFSSTRNPSSSASAVATAIHSPPSLLNWSHHRPPLLPPATTSIISSPANFHRDQTHLFLHNHLFDQPLPIGGHENDLGWQDGLSFLNPDSNPSTASEFLSSDGTKHERKTNKFKRSLTLPSRIMALSSSSSSSQHQLQQQQQQQPVAYRKSEEGPYQDVIGNFLE